jgi:cell division protein FtsW (lipid II flippase)
MAAHEDLSRKHAARGPSDRSFGFVFSAFFFLVAIAPLRKHHPVRWWALGIAVAFLAVSVLVPGLLKHLNRQWMRLGHLLGRITTPVVTGLLFYLVFTPAAYLTRWLGKDPLRLRFDAQADSYWQERRPPGPPPQDMANQF